MKRIPTSVGASRLAPRPRPGSFEARAPRSAFTRIVDMLLNHEARLINHGERLRALEGTPPTEPPPEPEGLTVGMYWSQGDRIDELAAEGFDRVYAWAAPDGSSLAFCDKARNLGLKVTLELNYLIGDGANTLADIDRWTAPYLDRPEVTHWKISDEPDLRGMDPDALYEGYAHLKARDPSRPIELVIRYPQRESGMPYIPSGDIIGLDSYPIPFGPASDVGAEIADAILVCAPKPVWAVIQTFDWGGTFGPNDPGRMPTAEEVEAMGVSALEAGAPHLWCYCDPDYRSLASAMPGIITRWRDVAAGRA